MKNNYAGEVPLGLGMALAQNVDALNNFVMLSETQRKAVIEGARNVASKQEMKSYVNQIADGGFH